MPGIPLISLYMYSFDNAILQVKKVKLNKLNNLVNFPHRMKI